MSERRCAKCKQPECSGCSSKRLRQQEGEKRALSKRSKVEVDTSLDDAVRSLQRIRKPQPTWASQDEFMHALLRTKGQSKDVECLTQASIKGMLAFATAQKANTLPTPEYLKTLIFGEPAVVFALHQFQASTPQPAQLQAPVPADPVTNDDIKAIYNYVGAFWAQHGQDPGIIQALLTYLGHLHVELQESAVAAAAKVAGDVAQQEVARTTAELQEGLLQEAETRTQRGFASLEATMTKMNLSLSAQMVDMKKELLAETSALRKELLAETAALRKELLDVKTELRQELLDARTELKRGQLDATAELIKAEKKLLETEEAIKQAMEARACDITKELADGLAKLNTELKAIKHEVSTVQARQMMDRVMNVSNANWAARVHNANSALWRELAADGPESDSFDIGLVDGSAINHAAPLGHRPAYNYDLWFPRNLGELCSASAVQVDPLLFFYAIPNPKNPLKKFDATTPLNEKIGALACFLSRQ